MQIDVQAGKPKQNPRALWTLCWNVLTERLHSSMVDSCRQLRAACLAAKVPQCLMLLPLQLLGVHQQLQTHLELLVGFWVGV